MVGAGVYTTSGFALADLGDPWWVLAAWAVGGVVALCGAASYGGLAGHFTASGGEYLFLSRTFGPAAGFLAGWVSLLAGFTGAAAFAAAAFAAHVPLPGAGYVLIAGCTALHLVRVRPGAGVQNALVAVKLLALATLVVWGCTATDWPAAGAVGAAPSAAAFATTVMWVSLSYSGFNAAVYLTDEVRAPARTVPRALLLGTLLVTALYLALNAVFVLAVPAEAVAGREDVAVAAAQALGGAGVATAVRCVIALSLATSVSALILTGPRVYAAMAADGLLPRAFAFRGEAPRGAVAVQGALAAAVLGAGTLRQLLSYLGVSLAVTAAVAVAGVFVVRRRGGAVPVPLYPLPPLVFLVGTAAFATLTLVRQPAQALAAAATLASGLVAYRLAGRKASARGGGAGHLEGE